MKTIKQFREEYESVMVQDAPDELMLEGRESSVIKSSEKAVPLPSVMPTMLMFRRVAYRQYPGKQVVALYYSKLVNKYLSIPFGPAGDPVPESLPLPQPCACSQPVEQTRPEAEPGIHAHRLRPGLRHRVLCHRRACHQRGDHGVAPQPAAQGRDQDGVAHGGPGMGSAGALFLSEQFPTAA